MSWPKVCADPPIERLRSTSKVFRGEFMVEEQGNNDKISVFGRSARDIVAITRMVAKFRAVQLLLPR